MDFKRKMFKNYVIRIVWAKLHSVLAHNMYSTQVTGTQYWKEILYISNSVTLNTNRNKIFTKLVLQVVYCVYLSFNASHTSHKAEDQFYLQYP